MKVTESYDGKRDDTKGPGLGTLVSSDFPSGSYTNFYSTKRKSVKMLRIHQLNLFHIR